MSTTFEHVQAVASIFNRYPKLWFISGGWAIDLHLDAVTRDHEDLEVGLLRRDQHTLRDLLLSEWKLEKVVDTNGNMAWVRWYEGEWLELPIHQVKALRDQEEPHEFEMFLNDLQGDEWCFRRLPQIRFPVSDVYLRTPSGIPYLRPEIQLLYKARIMRDKDKHDFEAVFPRLLPNQRRWLHDSLALFLPGHAWIAQLGRRDAPDS